MSQLSDLQCKFQNYILYQDDAIAQALVATDKVPIATRLTIYRNAYQIRLLEALVDSYKIVSQYLGTAAFTQLARDYLMCYPSTYRSIRWFGDQLSTFLQHHQAYQEMPYVVELAQLEWSMAATFDAPDALSLPIAAITTIAPTAWVTLKLQLHPSLQRHNFYWNVVALWEALSEDVAKLPPQLIQATVPQPWILWRNAFINHYAVLPMAEAFAIDAALQGVAFAEICEGLCQWLPEEQVPAHAIGLLKGWLSAGLVIGWVV